MLLAEGSVEAGRTGLLLAEGSVEAGRTGLLLAEKLVEAGSSGAVWCTAVEVVAAAQLDGVAGTGID